MAGGGQLRADGDVRERAETYLRLLAESELRHALGSPPIRRPGPGKASLPLRAAYQVLPPAAALTGRAVRPLDPLVRRVLGTRELGLLGSGPGDQPPEPPAWARAIQVPAHD